MRTTVPRPFLAYYPAIFPQKDLKEGVALLNVDGSVAVSASSGHPPRYERLEPRKNYDTAHPASLSSFGPMRKARLGDIVLARSGDKGANINLGVFVRRSEHYPWLRNFMTRARMQELMGDDWKDEGFFVERVEFPNINAVHFLIYGPLGRGVSSCRLLDCLGKGFADYIRDKVVEIPAEYLKTVEDLRDHQKAVLKGRL